MFFKILAISVGLVNKAARVIIAHDVKLVSLLLSWDGKPLLPLPAETPLLLRVSVQVTVTGSVDKTSFLENVLVID